VFFVREDLVLAPLVQLDVLAVKFDGRAKRLNRLTLVLDALSRALVLVVELVVLSKRD
jgi:hypothetical protein